MRASSLLLVVLLVVGPCHPAEATGEGPGPALVDSLFGIEGMPCVYLQPLEPARAEVHPINLRGALDRAEAAVREQGVDTSGQLLHSVSLRYDESPERRGSYWLVQWSWVEPRLGGEVSARVDMDGTVTVRRLGP